MYLYKAVIYHDTDDVVSIPDGNAAAITDFEDNHKSGCLEVDSLEVVETTFTFDKTYTEFDALVTGDLDWTDVRYIVQAKTYCLHLLVNNPL